MIPYALPPAETRLSIRAIANGYLGRDDDFAGALAGYLGTTTCVLADSARSLLFLLLRRLQSQAGPDKTEVLIPGYTCYSVPAAVVKAGLRVALYDVDPADFQPDMADVEKKINPSTLAIIGQHLLGVPSNIAGLTRIARRAGIHTIEDAAQLLRPGPANDADFTLYSFGRGKPLPLGHGGALIAANPSALTGMPNGSGVQPDKPGNYIMPPAVRIFSHPRLYWILERLPLGLGQTIYDPGFTVSPMPRFLRKTGTHALGELSWLNNHRIMISSLYHDRFHNRKGAIPGAANAPLVRYPLLVKNPGTNRFLFDHGVRRLYPLALCDLPALRESLSVKTEHTPGAREIARHLITLPTHSAVSQKAAAIIAGEVEKQFF